MLHDFDPLSTGLTEFVLLNWIITSCSAAFFVFIYFRHRYLLVKPSMIMLAMTHVLFQWPATIYAAAYETWLPQPFGMVALVHGFVVFGLIGSTLMFRGAALRAWDRIPAATSMDTQAGRQKLIFALVGLCALLAGAYFFYVPITCTGLYALVTRPESAPLAREISLKLLADPVPRYALTLLASSVVPLLTAVVTCELLVNRSSASRGRIAAYVAILISAWLLADLNGPKGIVVSLSLVVVFTIIWRRRLDVRIYAIPIMLGIALMPAYLITLLFAFSPIKSNANEIQACYSRIKLTMTQNEDNSLAASFDPKLIFSENTTEKYKSTVLMKKQRAETDLHAEENKTTSELDRLRQSIDVLLATENIKREVASISVASRIAIFLKITYIKIESFLALAYINATRVVKVMYIEATFHLEVAKDVSLFYIDIWWNQAKSVLNRSFIVPLEVGGWYVHYFQTHGAMGIGAIPRIARIAGQKPIDGQNLIGRTYGPVYYGHPVPQTISAGAGFLFSYFAYFGYWSIPIDLLLLWLTDIAAWVYGRVASALVVPLIATSTLTTMKFLESDYSATWLTHGFGVVLAIGLALTALLEIKSKVTRNANALGDSQDAQRATCRAPVVSS